MSGVEPYVGGAAELEPAEQRRLNSLWRQSVRLAHSGLVPDGLRGKPEDVMAVVLYGERFGLVPAHALAQIYVIKGRIVPSAQVMAGLAMRAGHQVRIKESSSESCTVAIRRREDRDDPEGWSSFSFTIEDAKRAGLLSKEVWRAYPGSMLAHRATTRAVRHVAPDVLLGLDVGGDDGLALEDVRPQHIGEVQQDAHQGAGDDGSEGQGMPAAGVIEAAVSEPESAPTTSGGAAEQAPTGEGPAGDEELHVPPGPAQQGQPT